MKIGMLTSGLTPKIGGIISVVNDLSCGLNKFDDCSVELYGRRYNDFADIQGYWDNISIKSFPGLGPSSFGYAFGLTKSLSSANLDLLHVHGCWSYPSIVSSKWSKICGRPYIVSIHGMLDNWALSQSKIKKKVAGWLYEDEYLNRASCIHALCNQEAESIRAIGLRIPICIIPNGIGLPQNRTYKAPTWYRSIPPGSKILLYFGRLHAKKGIEELLYAWEKYLHTKNKYSYEWHLVIAGWGESRYTKKLLSIARRFNNNNRVHFVGKQYGDSKKFCYLNSDAFILPSFSEGLPMVVLEAWASGLPVLMTSNCNLQDGFDVGAALKLETDSDSIYCGLATLFEMNDETRQTMGELGKSLVIQSFNWNTIALEMRAVYRWLLSGGKPPQSIKMN